MRALALVAAAAALASCGGDLAPDPDAGGCAVAVQFDPADPIAPTTIVARATVLGAAGLLSYTWTVRHVGADVATTPRTPDGRDIEFAAATPGVYEVALTVGGAAPSCPSWQGDLNVRDPGAGQGAVRLRFHPPAGAAAPVQERTVVVPGGADFALGVLSLDAGLDAPIVVRDPGGAAIAAYVRLRSRSTPDATVEITTSAAGTERALLAVGRYDALVVPLVDGLAPIAVSGWEPSAGAFTVGPGRAVTGRVLDAGGAGLAGARVAIAGGDDVAPSTVATTASDGGFTLAWQGGVGAELTVAPPVAVGRPRLRVPLETLDAGRALTVRYAPALATRDLDGAVARIDGAAVAGGHALIVAELAAAGTATDGLVQVAASGAHRDRVAIDATGHLAPYLVTAGPARAYLVPDDGGPGAVVVFDSTAAAPTALAGARPRAVTATVVDRAGVGLAGVRVLAQVGSDLAHLGAPTAAATTAGDGRLSLALAAGASYDLTLIDPRGGQHRAVVSGADVALGALPLAPTLTLTGEVRIVGQSTGLDQTAVTVRCAVCTGLDRERPLGAAVSDVTGGFAVAIPDPTTPP